MLSSIFGGLFDTASQSVISPGNFILCMITALICGIILSAAYMIRSAYSKSFIVTLALLPAVVCVVIMMVNGNIGAGVAVAGAFSLVRFRSVPGSAREIAALFTAMGTGLILGMGYLAYGILFTVVMGIIMTLYNLSKFGARLKVASEKTVNITIPEDLDYTNVFDDVFSEYASYYNLVKVKTTNLGSLFKLTYDVKLKDPAREKEFIDSLRVRNGNLEISMFIKAQEAAEL